MLWVVVAASQLTAAVPIDPVGWFSDLDWEMLVGKSGHALTLIRVTVTPEGKPQDCTIEATSGIPKLDKVTCDRVLERARFRPAKSKDGEPAYGVYRRDVLWADLSSFRYFRPMDIEVALSRMPKGTHAPEWLRIQFTVDATGHPSSCEAPGHDANKTLEQIACQQLLSGYPVIPAKNGSGRPVSSIQNAMVSFITK